MKMFVSVVVILIIGYLIGVKYPSLGTSALAKVGM